jgi:hypothetical protein
MKLIDKDALLAEIERLKNTSLEYGYNTMQKVLADSGKDISLRQLQNFINDLEVKEVDLDYIKDELDEVVKIHKPNGDFGWGTLYNVATHFFELGLRASQSTVSVYGIEEALKENGIDPDSKEADMYREAIYKIYDRLKAQKG